MSYIEVCSKVAQVAFDLLIHLFGTRRISLVPNTRIVGKGSGASARFRLVFATQQGAHTLHVAVHYTSPYITRHHV